MIYRQVEKSPLSPPSYFISNIHSLQSPPPLPIPYDFLRARQVGNSLGNLLCLRIWIKCSLGFASQNLRKSGFACGEYIHILMQEPTFGQNANSPRVLDQKNQKRSDGQSNLWKHFALLFRNSSFCHDTRNLFAVFNYHNQVFFSLFSPYFFFTPLLSLSLLTAKFLAELSLEGNVFKGKP